MLRSVKVGEQACDQFANSVAVCAQSVFGLVRVMWRAREGANDHFLLQHNWNKNIGSNFKLENYRIRKDKSDIVLFDEVVLTGHSITFNSSLYNVTTGFKINCFSFQTQILCNFCSGCKVMHEWTWNLSVITKQRVVTFCKRDFSWWPLEGRVLPDMRLHLIYFVAAWCSPDSMFINHLLRFFCHITRPAYCELWA